MDCSFKIICQMVTRGFPHRQVLGLLPFHIFNIYLQDKQKHTLINLWMKLNVEEEDNMLKNRVALQ